MRASCSLKLHMKPLLSHIHAPHHLYIPPTLHSVAISIHNPTQNLIIIFKRFSNMGSFQYSRIPYPLLVLVFLSFIHFTCGTRNLLSLYQPPPMGLTYHNGALLEGELKLSILWYGKFSPAQKSIIVDFLDSLNSAKRRELLKTPTVSKWWQTIH